jgi:hypothetical protein
VGDIDCDASRRRILIADTSDLSDNESSGLTNGVHTEAEGAGMLRLTASSRVSSTRFGAPTKRAIQHARERSELLEKMAVYAQRFKEQTRKAASRRASHGAFRRFAVAAISREQGEMAAFVARFEPQPNQRGTNIERRR